ncbi:phosphomannomutase/phosphoglucomutase [Candidatus Woesearchaeota archaeon]|nr:phosphomannomutase/phosphoglucomutase [Candidatus Woesearchaeota archaeon]
MGIFKAYDIRGVYPVELDEEIVYKIGRAVVLLLNPRNVVIGRDCRTSSPKLADALSRGVRDQGADVIDIGLASSPLFYAAVAKGGYDAGVMLTASHNPKQYNGCKIVREKAIPVGYDDGIRRIEEMIKMSLPLPPIKKGSITRKEVLGDYAKHVLSICGSIGDLRVVVDSANGMAGYTFPPIYAQFPLKVTHLYKDLDGTFPNHEPDPLNVENLRDLQAAVKKEKADVGLAFDADADRVIMVDEKGDVVPADLILVLLGKELSIVDPKARIIYDCRSSQVIAEEFGARAIRHRVGHAFIKKSMRKDDVALGGEISGHFYFRDAFFTDDAVVAALKLLHILSKRTKPLSELIQPYQRYARSGETNFHVPDPKASVERVAKEFKDLRQDRMDGVTIWGVDWWTNVRPSNTEPLLRVCAEAKDKKLLDEIMAKIVEIIEK